MRYVRVEETEAQCLYPADMQTGFYNPAEAMLLGHGMDAPEWVAAGFAYNVEHDNEVRGRASTPREFPTWTPPSPRYIPGMKSEHKTEPAKRGGKREGAGRKALDDQGTVVVTLRLTGQQKATYDLLGGKDWLRGQLDLFAEGKCKP